MNRDLTAGLARFPAALVRWCSEQIDRGLFATDCELRIVLWNRWLESHTGRRLEDVAGRPVLEACPELVARGFEPYFRDALAGRISVISYGLHQHLLALPPTNADLGLSGMPQSARIGPLLDGDEVIGTVTSIADISDRVAAEAELRRQVHVETIAREAAEDALRTKDEFLSVLSHEMRTPLNAVVGWTRMLLEQPNMDDETRVRALRVIDRNAAAQARMMDDLLDVARISNGKLQLEIQTVDLVTVALAAIDALSVSASLKQIEIRTRFAEPAQTVAADPQRLQQIVGNLLSNAVKFTEAGGVVEVQVTRAGSAVRLVVSDTGHGIAAEFLPFVFEPFRQGDVSSTRHAGGLGLGLALVRQLVEMHGGTVRAESAGADRGSTFTIEFPFAAPSAVLSKTQQS